MLELPDSWLWDFWIADTGAEYHLFFLRASRALHDPHRRHRRASVGHAVSTDLRTWRLAADAIVPADEPRWDDLAIWTGSVVRDDAGAWRMFYTGLSRADGGLVQRIGVATSADLDTWTTSPQPLVEADPRWYVTPEQGREVFWRDPWVSRAPGGSGWQMLVTAQSRGDEVPPDDRGVLALAVSDDLEHWDVRAPATEPGSGFLQLEVPQTEVVDGRGVLLFSCLGSEVAAVRGPVTGGTWAVAADSPTGPFDVHAAELLLDETYYSARLIRDRAGDWQALAFVTRDGQGRFVGRLSDPMPVRWLTSTRLTARLPG